MSRDTKLDLAEKQVERISSKDNVAVALSALSAGTRVSVSGQEIEVLNDIPAFHKFALKDIPCGHPVLRFGEQIGLASEKITTGEHIHSHNLVSDLGSRKSYDLDLFEESVATPKTRSRNFLGYRRFNGTTGTRNEIWIIPTVGCVSRTAETVARRASDHLNGRADAVLALPHPHGCSQLGGDQISTRKALASLAGNPNVGGVVFIALGCETNQIDALLPEVKGLPQERVRVVRSQMVADEGEAAFEAVEDLLNLTALDQRSVCGLEHLVIGLKCGGSDALSGLTANPLLGDITNMVVAAGGKAVLTEIPEIFGAEHLLMKRTPGRANREAIATLVNDFKDYYTRSGHPVNENPSPGNKAGGITTLEEKSLGAVQKAGSAPVQDVIAYGESVRTSGLTLLEAPGNDAVSCTALAAAGVNVILFTTGRGTPLGFPVPTLKVASNSDLASRKPNWIDFNAGQVLNVENRQLIAEALLDQIIAVASGELTCNEKNNERSIAIWKRGVTL